MPKSTRSKSFTAWLSGRQGKTNKNKEESRLESLPVEILLEIFKNLEAGASLCLALSSPYLFNVHKTARIEIPSLWTDVGTMPEEAHPIPDEFPRAKIPLGSLLETWIGAKYRPLVLHLPPVSYYKYNVPNPPFFVRKSVYRSQNQEVAMLIRYRTYHKSMRSGHHILPNPRNRGPEWEKEVKKIIVADVENFPSFNAWGEFWAGKTTIGSDCSFWVLGRWNKVVAFERFWEMDLQKMYPERKRTQWERARFRYGIYHGTKKIPYFTRFLPS